MCRGTAEYYTWGILRRDFEMFITAAIFGDKMPKNIQWILIAAAVVGVFIWYQKTQANVPPCMAGQLPLSPYQQGPTLAQLTGTA